MTSSILESLLAVLVVMPLVACGGGNDGGNGIVDIGKSCSSESDCEHVCVVLRGQSSGQCSIECTAESDCPSFMDCIASSSTGERRCFDPGGLVTATLPVLCRHACADVNYFCSTDAVTDGDQASCEAWCDSSSDEDLQALIDCVDESDRYGSACPATECLAVAGAAVLLEGFARSRGRVLEPKVLRELLRRTGTPQAGDTKKHIGPRPDLARALAVPDLLGDEPR